jgi:hypothetical protein
MTTLRNEVTPQVRTQWQDNFDNEKNNIFDAFHNSPIILTKAMYEKLCLKFNSNIRIYFGKDNAGSPKLIASAALKLNEMDSDNLDNAWDDIAGADTVYELYAGTAAGINQANDWIANWTNDHQNDPLYVKSFLLPRTSFISIFEYQKASFALIALIDFGLKKEITVMTQLCNASGQPGQDPIVNNRSMPCPPFCAKFSPIG